MKSFKRLDEFRPEEMPRLHVPPGRFTYLYLLVDPTDGTIRYVGVSSKPELRLLSHIRKPSNKALGSWIMSLAVSGHKPRMHVVGRVGEQFWASAERAYIAFFRSRSVIYNHHPGGPVEGGGCSPSMNGSHVAAPAKRPPKKVKRKGHRGRQAVQAETKVDYFGEGNTGKVTVAKAWKKTRRAMIERIKAGRAADQYRR